MASFLFRGFSVREQGTRPRSFAAEVPDAVKIILFWIRIEEENYKDFQYVI